MEELLINEDYMLQSILRAAPIGIGVVRDRVIKLVSDRLCEIVGYDREELIGQNDRMLYPTEEDFEYVGVEKYAQIQNTGIGTVETRWKHKDGSNIDVLLSSTVIDPDDLSGGITFIVLDITSKKNADATLFESEERYRSLIESVDDSLYLVDADCKYLFVNKIQLSRLGKQLKEVVGRKYSEFHPADDTKVFIEKVHEVLQTGNPVRYEHKSRTDDNYFLRTLSPIKEFKGNVKSVLVVSKDITFLKHAEAALKESSEQIKLFSYSISHDLKNPAISIYLLAKRFKKKFENVLDESAKNYCDQILKAAEQIKELVNQINVYISTKEIPKRIEWINMNEILQEIKKEFSLIFDLRKIIWSQPENIPMIKIDRLSILRAMRNLIDNALKYGGDDLTEIKIGYDESESLHIISVYDDGIGIEDKNLKKIFNKFHRNESSNGIEGIGLGLSIVKSIAVHHGGDAWVEPGNEKGKTFYLSISKYL
jgi:PAS domain S-box-containing protein